MSEQNMESTPTFLDGDLGFAAVMDTLVPDEAPEQDGADTGTPDSSGDAGAVSADQSGDSPETAEPAEEAGGQSGGTDQVHQADTGASAESGEAAEGTGGGSDTPAAAGGRTPPPADWTATAASRVAEINTLAERIEETTARQYQEEAFNEVKEEHSKYFDALGIHPRRLVGQEVPSLNGEGMERLRTTEDARDWQEAVKDILSEEVRDRAGRAIEAAGPDLDIIHSSIQLFQNNHDLIPQSKDFDVDLANRFAQVAKPYEKRNDAGKLVGYSIPVQPLLDQLRKDLHETRSKSGAVHAGSNVKPPKQSKNTGNDSRPQGGIQSKSGSSGADEEDFSTLFGTLGLPNLQL